MSSELKALAMAQELDAIPTPTPTAARMLELAMDRESTPRQFIEVISTDPALALQLLRNATAPERKDVPGLEVSGAVDALDRADLERLAFTACTCEGIGGVADRDERSGMNALRLHSIATATAAREMAFMREYFQPEEAFTGGLLCATGELALATLKPEESAELRRRIVGQDRFRRLELEEDLLGADHDRMAVALAEAWDLAPGLRQVLVFQGRTSGEIDRDCPRQDQELVSLVRAGRIVAERAGFPAFEGLPEQELEEDVVEILEAVDLDSVIEAVQAAVQGSAEKARPERDDIQARVRNLRVANNQLAHLLARSEHQRRTADSVMQVLRYGLHRLEDEDFMAGLMVLVMKSMGFKRATFIESRVEDQQLAVKESSAMLGRKRAQEGRWVPFPTQNRAFGIPTIASRDDGVPEHHNLLELLEVSSCAIAPLIEPVGGKCYGYLAVDHGPAGSPPLPGDEQRLGIIADQACMMSKYASMRQDMRRMASADPLTGAATRRRLMDKLEDQIALMGRTRQPLSLAIMDLDHFKKFNDTMGHQVGDKLLKNLVRVLQSKVRKTDLVARYGGEEFVVVFHGADLENATRLCNMLRQAVFDYGVERAEEYNHTPISISIGVAEVETTEDGAAAEDAMALIGRADTALYEAKHNGRNRVERAA
jgi:diguanylate cyclase (GGDEF)-like protein